MSWKLAWAWGRAPAYGSIAFAPSTTSAEPSIIRACDFFWAIIRFPPSNAPNPPSANISDLCSFVVLDALNPLNNLAFLRHKILHIHLTNVYDNLPDEEIARRDGRLYAVQVRAYIPSAERSPD